MRPIRVGLSLRANQPQPRPESPSLTLALCPASSRCHRGLTGRAPHFKLLLFFNTRFLLHFARVHVRPPSSLTSSTGPQAPATHTPTSCEGERQRRMGGGGAECQPKRGRMARALWDPQTKDGDNCLSLGSFLSDPGGTAPTLAKFTV